MALGTPEPAFDLPRREHDADDRDTYYPLMTSQFETDTDQNADDGQERPQNHGHIFRSRFHLLSELHTVPPERLATVGTSVLLDSCLILSAILINSHTPCGLHHS